MNDIHSLRVSSEGFSSSRWASTATVALGKKKHDIITTAIVIITLRVINKTLEGEGSVCVHYVYAAEDFHQSKRWKTKIGLIEALKVKFNSGLYRSTGTTFLLFFYFFHRSRKKD